MNIIQVQKNFDNYSAEMLEEYMMEGYISCLDCGKTTNEFGEDGLCIDCEIADLMIGEGEL